MDYTKGKWNCTCDAGYKGEVYHCPLHAAAYDMYEALKDCLISIRTAQNLQSAEHLEGARMMAYLAVKKAEGRDA